MEFDMTMQVDDKLKHEMSGTTANTVLIKDNKLYCGNVGDSRAVCCIDGECHELSFDHKPNHPHEEKRIREAGGWVEYNRVNGNLALSRALGDFAFKRNVTKLQKDQMVCAFPDVEERTIGEGWEFVLMACDGIWDVISNEEACEFVRYSLGSGMEPDKICEELMTACLAPDCQMGGLGCDNMTVILICLLHGNSWESYSGKIANSLDSSLLSFTRRITDYSSGLTTTDTSSDDDEEEVISSANMEEAEKIKSALCQSLSKSMDNLLSNPGDQGEVPVLEDKLTPHGALEDVMQATDYIHQEKEGEVVVLRRVQSSSSAGGSTAAASSSKKIGAARSISPSREQIPGSSNTITATSQLDDEPEEEDEENKTGLLTGDLFSVLGEEVLPPPLPDKRTSHSALSSETETTREVTEKKTPSK